MASPKAVSSLALRNSDLRRKRSCSLFLASTKSSSISDLDSHNNHLHRIEKNSSSSNSLCSTTMVDNLLLRNKEYGEDQTATTESMLLNADITLLDPAGAVTAISDNETSGGVAPTGQERISEMPTEKKTKLDDLWKEIVVGRRKCKEEAPVEMMTLEDFLAKAEAVEEEEDVKVRLSGGSIRGLDSMAVMSPFSPRQISGGVVGGFGDGEEVIGVRPKRRAILEPLDKAAQQRQRRMIKNRESAARSRERKQAYQVELESLVVKLEEENEKLLKEKVYVCRQQVLATPQVSTTTPPTSQDLVASSSPPPRPPPSPRLPIALS